MRSMAIRVQRSLQMRARAACFARLLQGLDAWSSAARRSIRPVLLALVLRRRFRRFATVQLKFEAINKLAGHRFSQPICSPANRPGLTGVDEKLHFTALSWTCKRKTQPTGPPAYREQNHCHHADHIAGVRDDARPGGAAATPTSPN